MANPRNYPNFPDGEADVPRAYTALRDAVSEDVEDVADKETIEVELQDGTDSDPALATLTLDQLRFKRVSFVGVINSFGNGIYVVLPDGYVGSNLFSFSATEYGSPTGAQFTYPDLGGDTLVNTGEAKILIANGTQISECIDPKEVIAFTGAVSFNGPLSVQTPAQFLKTVKYITTNQDPNGLVLTATERHTIGLNASVPRTLALPTLTLGNQQSFEGLEYRFVRTAGAAVTIAPTAGQGESRVLASVLDAVVYQCIFAKWYIVSSVVH